MGSANNSLIAPSVLYNNPGITKEEFVKLLDETRTGDGTLDFYQYEHWIKYPWNFIGVEDPSYHKGLHGLAELLGLEPFSRIEWKKEDRNRISLFSPSLDIVAVRRGSIWFPPHYRVTVHYSNRLLEEETTEGWGDEPVKKGDVWIDQNSYIYLVNRVIEQRPLKKSEIENFEEEDLIRIPKLFVKIRGNQIARKGEEIIFSSLDLLLQRFPFFNPDFMYDFSQENGVFVHTFLVPPYNYEKRFRWAQRNGRYYIDIEGLTAASKLIYDKHSGWNSQLGYTDLIVSAEALRHKAWKLFGFHGYEQERTDTFLEAFPDAKRTHEKAVWDAYTSEFAKNQGMTVNELLRLRLMRLQKED